LDGNKLEGMPCKPEICPVCKKTSLRGRQQYCSAKCRCKSYRSRLRGSADPIPGVSRRLKSDPAPTMQVDSDPQAVSLLPIVGGVVDEPLLPTAAEPQVAPILVEQEVVPLSVLPIVALSLRSTPKPRTESPAQKAWDSIPNVAPRRSWLLSNIETLQERIDAANADLIAASQSPGRANRRDPGGR